MSTRLLAVTALCGCLHGKGPICADGRRCPSDQVCDDVHALCVDQAQLDSCFGAEQLAPCAYPGVAMGQCLDGVCFASQCGNGTLDPGEVCDDNNAVSGDGCRADCAKIETCGDGEADVGEGCDDANVNPADGCDACALTTWQVSVAVGSPVAATSVALFQPQGIAVDRAGRVYVADTVNFRVRRIELDGTITTIAGTGASGFAGDGGPATAALLNTPTTVAVDGLGRVFIADRDNDRIRVVDTEGTITTIAGTGAPGSGGDGGPATAASLSKPYGVAVDGLGNLFIADTNGARIRRVDGNGVISTYAGSSQGFSGDGGVATSAQLSAPLGVAVDPTGAVLIADTNNNRIRRVDPTTGLISTIAGGGAGGDGGPATSAQLSGPQAIAFDPQGGIVIAEYLGQRIRRFDVGGMISTIAGSGTQGFSGDGASALSAALNGPSGVGIDMAGNVWIADRANHRVRSVVGGTITTVAGSGTPGSGGDNEPATTVALRDPWATAVDAMGRIVIADLSGNVLRRIDATGTITTIAGTSNGGYNGDGMAATATELSGPSSVAIDGAGRIVFADSYNHRIRRIETNGTITTIAGTGTSGAAGDGGLATAAQLSDPQAIAIDGAGRIVIADTGNHRIRRIELDNTITTIAGTSSGFSGDGGAATSAQLWSPAGVAIDGAGRVVVGDSNNHRVRRFTVGATIATIAGTGTGGFNGDGILATAAQLNNPQGVTIDLAGRVVVADRTNHRVRRIELDNTITTLAGTGTTGFTGDGAPAANARLQFPSSVTVDGTGRVLVADEGNLVVRRIDTAGTITTIAGPIDPEHVGPVAAARLADPRALVAVGPLTVVAAGVSGTVEAIRGGRVEVIAGRYPQDVATGTLARFRTTAFGTVGGVAVDPANGTIYLSETTGNALYKITQVDQSNPATWTIAPLANASGAPGFADGPASSTARFRGPTGLALDPAAQLLYIADTGNHAIRTLALGTGAVTTIVNTAGALGFSGDLGPATSALLYRPSAVARCANGDLFIADTGNSRVRRVSAGQITTVASGVDHPRGLACDDFGNIFVTASSSVRMLSASNSGVVDGTLPSQTIYGAPPATMFPASVTACLTGLTFASPTKLQVADACTGLVVEIDRTKP